MSDHPLSNLPSAFHQGRPSGITSVCSAHPIVIEAALRQAKRSGRPALIEATCNQVNQDGGYTGMTPADFRNLVQGIARQADCHDVEIVLGGDHLGPNPWRALPAAQAMEKAEAMIAAYAAAGFTKLHLDTSMGCEGEPVALDDERTADRAARLAAVAELAASEDVTPVYVIGTEVPTPGGASEDLESLAVTAPESVRETYDVHKRAFETRGLQDAFARVIALVVQPGVEFGHSEIVHFDPAAATQLSACLFNLPGVVFEAHSTDYQRTHALTSLVQHGFAILKVGPWLTFALREALFGLDAVADVMNGHAPRHRLMDAMERLMLAEPIHWRTHYKGSEIEQWRQRHFSLSDRIRYYWSHPQATAAVEDMMTRLDEGRLAPALLSQYVPSVRTLEPITARDALIEAVTAVLDRYDIATQSKPS